MICSMKGYPIPEISLAVDKSACETTDVGDFKSVKCGGYFISAIYSFTAQLYAFTVLISTQRQETNQEHVHGEQKPGKDS